MEWERKENGSFQGSPEGIVFLLGAGLYSLRSRMRGFCDLLREKPASLLVLLGWRERERTSNLILEFDVLESDCSSVFK